MKKTVSAQVPKRKFKNQDELFVFLVWGYRGMFGSTTEADSYVVRGHRLGINYFDVAPSYLMGKRR